MASDRHGARTAKMRHAAENTPYRGDPRPVMEALLLIAEYLEPVAVAAEKVAFPERYIIGTRDGEQVCGAWAVYREVEGAMADGRVCERVPGLPCPHPLNAILRVTECAARAEDGDGQ